MKRMLFWLAALLALIGLLSACTDLAPADVPADVAAIGDPVAGRLIFETGGPAAVPCATCHTLDGTELVGPSLQGIADRAASRTTLSAEDYIRQSILEPSVYVVEDYADVMYKEYASKLSADDVDNVIAFLLSK
jgi:cytochrome c553